MRFLRARHPEAGCFCLELSHEVAIRLSAGRSCLKDKSTHVMIGRPQFCAGDRCGGLRFLATYLQGCLSVHKS